MRLLNRLNQYQRLWQPSSGAPQQVTVGELSARCFCSERHIRTLLRQAQQAGWLSWQSSAGRGKRGTLTFHRSPETLRNEMMELALNNGQQKNALELAQLATGELKALLSPFLGGQWQNNTPTLRIPYYRPLDPLQPGFLPGRAEQHLAGQIFSGLTRFDAQSRSPVGDLAHHWQISADGLRWQFFIRSTLFWHNGDSLETAQIQQRLLMLLNLPVLRTLFASIKQIDVTHTQCLTITLFRPDFWLPFRLASYCSVLAHPDDPTVGSGPFRLTLFSPELVRLENHPRYHLNHPLIQTVEYWITPQLFEQNLGTSCRHPVQITIGDPDELTNLRQVSNSISLGFCYLALHQSPRLSNAQAQRLVSLIHRSSLLETLPLDEDLITPSNEVLPGWTIPQGPENHDIQLPKRLTLLYHLPVELHTMAEQLRLRLAALGCELTLIFHDAKNWQGCQDLPQADLIMGDRLIGESPEYTLEQWLRCDAMWPNVLTGAQYAHLQATLDAVQAQPEERSRNDALRNVFNGLMDDAIMTPLFNYNYRISAPPGVNGLELNARGWFDFTSAWLPASAP